MEKGFLSTIQSWYVDDELSVDADLPQEKLRSRNSGRFIQLVLLELAKREPKTFEKIIREKISGIPLGSFVVQREYSCDSIDQRFADLAILSKGSSEPLVLIEIKYDDTFIRQNVNQKSDQLTSYINECKKKHCALLILSKDILSTKDVKTIEKARNAGLKICNSLLGEFGEQFKNSAKSTIAHMFYDFLKDKGLIMQKIDKDMLYKFFHRLVNPWSGAGKIQALSFAQGGAGNFQQLLNNMSVVSNSMARVLSSSNRKPNIDFSIIPTIKTNSKKLREAVEAKENYDVLYQDRVGGSVWVFATSTLYNNNDNGGGNWLNIQYGYCFTVTANSSKDIDSFLYAQVSSKTLNVLDEDGFRFTSSELKGNKLSEQLANKGSTEGKFLALIETVASEVIKSDQLSDKSHIKALKELIERIRN